jgi:hypothetical protein
MSPRTLPGVLFFLAALMEPEHWKEAYHIATEGPVSPIILGGGSEEKD